MLLAWTCCNFTGKFFLDPVFIFPFTGLVAIFTCLTGYKIFVFTVTYWNRWDYSNPGYLDALKHITDLKEQGKNCILFPDE